jgi:restriction system protein
MSQGQKALETVSLDDMDWFEFQQFVAHLFERLGFGSADEILKGKDEGRDIILRSYKGVTIVECKHQPKSSIGRPVVQKLHSAVITANAQKGYLVTTGHFSENAIAYSRALRSTIELVDSKILSDMANKARIRLLKIGEKTSVFHVIPPSQVDVEKRIIEEKLHNLISYPNNPIQLSKVEITEIEYVPVYLLGYALHQNFSTTIGVVHNINIDDGRVFINGEDGRAFPSRLATVVSQPSMVEEWHSPDKWKGRLGSFRIDFSTAKRLGTEHIQKSHTELVGYRGGNNVYYQKECVPTISNILIKNLIQVYIPFLTISHQILLRKHEISLCGNPEKIEILSGVSDNCEVCGKPLPKERLLCNSCGKIVHVPQLISGHSYYCEICKKTICKECTFWLRKYLFLKKKICNFCGEMLRTQGKDIKKLS